MGTLHSSAACIGFYGDDLDPSEITRLLGGQPTVGVAAGETFVTSRGAEKLVRSGRWVLEAERCAPEDLDGQIKRLFSVLNSDLGAWKSLAERFRGRVFCGLFLASGNDGLTLQPETLLMIGERGLLLDLDIYDHTLLD